MRTITGKNDTSAITEYSKTEAALSELSHRYKGVIFDLTTKEGMQTTIKGRAEIRGFRVDLEKTRVKIKAPALEKCQLIDSEARRITAELLAIEEPIDAQIKLEEKRKEDERTASERAEQARIEAEQAAIKLAEEQRIADERAALQKMREELEMKQRAQDELDRIARAKIEEEQRAARLKIEEEERSARMIREDSDRKARLAREAEEAKARKLRDEEEARLKAERDKIEAERRAVEEQKRKAREAEEAKAREEQRKAAELEDAHGMLDLFVKRFGHLEKFESVVKSILALPAQV